MPGPVRTLLGGEASPAAFLFSFRETLSRNRDSGTAAAAVYYTPGSLNRSFRSKQPWR
jgi:hypothetical protein